LCVSFSLWKVKSIEFRLFVRLFCQFDFAYFAILSYIYIYMVFPCAVTPTSSSVLFNRRNFTKRKILNFKIRKIKWFFGRLSIAISEKGEKKGGLVFSLYPKIKYWRTIFLKNIIWFLARFG
jgi:hypothetical protein